MEFVPHDLKEISKTAFVQSKGYIQVYYTGHPLYPKREKHLLHRLIMENNIGRYLDRKEVVHHVDRCRSNNNSDNLVLLASAKDHGIEHSSPFVKTCRKCGKEFPTTRSRPGSFCSIKCYGTSREVTAWPSDNDLFDLVWRLPFTVIARYLEVSDNAVRKRCKARGIPLPG